MKLYVSQGEDLDVLMISKACVVGVYQKKLEELARFPDVKLTLAVPPSWHQNSHPLPLERLYTSGYELVVLPVLFNGHFHYHVYRGLAGLVRRVRPDIVHIDEEPYNLATWQAMRIAKQAGAKALFFTWQNLLRRYPFPFSKIERYNFRHADAAIAGNEEAVRVLRAKGYAGPSYVIPQFGVDPELYRRLPVARNEWPFVIAYVGRLVEEKGIQVLLKAIAGLAGDYVLRIVGAGPYKVVLERLVADLGLNQRVQFMPPIPAAQIPRFLSGVDALVLPSVTRENWKEQFGRVLIEAMACEVAVVGSSSGEIPHLIADAGLVFPEGDARALRDELNRLMENREWARELGKKGRERVLQRYTQQQIAQQTHEVYRDLIGLS